MTALGMHSPAVRRPPLTVVRPAPALPGLVGGSAPMRELLAAIRAYAGMPWPALVLGETGSGKEAVARALHTLSPRAGAPFVAVNCAALPDELAECAFFGHERGAFTGAERRQEGLLQRTGNGTLFLNEIGDLAPRIQAKLLRVFQEGTYQRVGGDCELAFSGRIVAATHRALLDEPAAGSGPTFRADLFHRLSACVIRVPSLRERREDIPALAQCLLDRALAQLPDGITLRLGRDASARLAAHDWPGNVRELENVIRRGVALALADEGAEILSCHLSVRGASGAVAPMRESAGVAGAASQDADASGGGSLGAATRTFERQVVLAALAANAGNKTKTARELGVSAQWLHRLLGRWREDRQVSVDRTDRDASGAK